jgi:hypothetical protein
LVELAAVRTQAAVSTRARPALRNIAFAELSFPPIGAYTSKLVCASLFRATAADSTWPGYALVDVYLTFVAFESILTLASVQVYQI